MLHLIGANFQYNTDMIITVHTPTNNLQESIDFYQKLNYKLLSKENPTLLTDGNAIIEINPDRYARPGIKMYKESWSKEIQELKKMTSIHQIEKGYLLNDFNGCWIYLMEHMLDIENLPSPSDSSFGMTGNFSGLSLEASDFEKSFKIWSQLGFKIQMGAIEKGFVVLQNDQEFSVSLMKPLSCPHLFFNPSMTFFNGKKNMKIIGNIREANIPITEEITYFNKKGIVDNIIIRDPGGYGFLYLAIKFHN